MNNSNAIRLKKALLLFTTAVYVLLCNFQPQPIIDFLQGETQFVTLHQGTEDETADDKATVLMVASPNALLPAVKIFIDQSFHIIKETFNPEPVKSTHTIYLEHIYNPIVNVLFPLIISPNAP